jgi:hypothetical protein
VGASEFADVERDTAYFDAFCMWQVRNPEWFDVVVAPNLVGDVISDSGAPLKGEWASPRAATSAIDRHVRADPRQRATTRRRNKATDRRDSRVEDAPRLARPPP